MIYIINYWHSYNKHETSCHFMIPMFSMIYTDLPNFIFFSIKEKVLCNNQIIEIITNSFVHFHLFFITLSMIHRKEERSRKKNNGGESKSLLWFSVVFSVQWSTIACKSLIAVTFSTSIMLTRGPSCCGNFAEE